MGILEQLWQASKFSIGGFEIRPQWADHGTVLEALISKPDGERYAISERMWTPVEGESRIEFVMTKKQVCSRMAQQIHDAVYGLTPPDATNPA